MPRLNANNQVQSELNNFSMEGGQAVVSDSSPRPAEVDTLPEPDRQEIYGQSIISMDEASMQSDAMYAPPDLSHYQDSFYAGQFDFDPGFAGFFGAYQGAEYLSP